MAKILQNQLFEGKSWNDYTHRNHLIGSGAYNPVQIAQKLEQITQVDLREDFVTSVMSHGTFYMDENKEVYQWFLENAAPQNYELLGSYTDQAMTSACVSGTNYGINGTPIFMLFANKPFLNTEHIVGRKPDLYMLRVAETPLNVGGNRYLYRVQLVNGGRAATGIPGAELLSGYKWSSAGGSIPDDRSYDGFGIQFKTNGMLETRLGRFRMKHILNSRTKDIKPLYFFVTHPKTGKPFKTWLYNVEYEFYRKARLATAQIIMYGQTTVKSDGTTVIYDQNGESVTTGVGFKPQWAASGLRQWTLQPNLDELVEIALSVSVGKIPINQRNYFIKAGEWGLMELSKMVQRQLGASAYQSMMHLGDTTGRAYKWGVNGDENGINVKLGQFMGVATINGIKFWFVIDPAKDDPSRNQILHPNGGYASSYEYDIFLKDSKEIQQILRRKGENPTFYVEEGVNGYYPGGSSFNTPARISSAVEGSVIHYFEPGVGAVVWDPTKIVRYYPSLTWS